MAIAKPNPQAFAVFVATFVATSVFAVAMLSRVASMAPGATPLGATSEKLGLAWIDGAMFCGDWPTPAEIAPIAKIMATVTGEPVAQGCAGASKTIIAKNKHMDAAACAAWCPTAAPGGTSDWCCTFTETLTAHGTAEACTVSDGVATMIPSTSALVTTQAFSNCGPPPGMLGASNTYEEYPCPEKKMQNALNFGEDGCSQICLPHAFFGARLPVRTRAPSRAAAHAQPLCCPPPSSPRCCRARDPLLAPTLAAPLLPRRHCAGPRRPAWPVLRGPWLLRVQVCARARSICRALLGWGGVGWVSQLCCSLHCAQLLQLTRAHRHDNSLCANRFSNSQSGVHYNVYNKAGETYVMPDWPPPRE